MQKTLVNANSRFEQILQIPNASKLSVTPQVFKWNVARLTATDRLKKLSTILKPVSDEQNANAAVTVILKPKKEDFEVLLVKRTQNPTDPWSGQMALPGGKRDPRDPDLKTTAIRETFEETGVDLSSSRFLGVTTTIQSEPRRDFQILPFIVLLEQEPTIKLNKCELEAFIWVSHEKIIRSKSIAEVSLRRVPAYVLENADVWGITYKILNEFSYVLEKIV